MKINEEDLHRFYEYDLSLRGFIADIKGAIEALAEACGETIEETMISLDESIDALADMIDERESVATDIAP